jgi:two-component system chemotaxis response regulator CheB
MAQIFAIGASQGGVQALRSIVAKLPGDFPGVILVVVHTGEESLLPLLLSEVGDLEATHATDGERIRPAHIFIAPPGRHMLVVGDHLELTYGPRENFARPAIDPLFRTVAEAYGPAVAGLVLTGRLNDGTAGLYEIKRRGGTAIVQDPATAEVPSMPRSALENVPIDYCVSIADIPSLLISLAKKDAAQELKPLTGGVHDMAMGDVEARPTAQTCPECGGAMKEERLGTLTQYRCHIGHVMTAEVLAASQLDCLQRDMSSVLRFLNERAGLCLEMAEKYRAQGNTAAAEAWERAAEEATGRKDGARAMNDNSWQHPEARESD